MNYLHIQLNNEIVDRYKKEGLSIDYMGSVLIILHALYEGNYEILDSIDDNNKEKRMLILYQYLHRKDFLSPTDLEDDVHYVLTEKAIDFIKFCESFAEETRTAKNTVKKEGVVEETADINSWILDWINIFPEGKIEGRYLRTNKLECADRMRWFMKEYSYDRDTIIRATKAYIDSQASGPNGHTYTRNASYFIFKGRSKAERTSDLASWCDRVLDDNNPIRESFQRDVA